MDEMMERVMGGEALTEAQNEQLVQTFLTFVKELHEVWIHQRRHSVEGHQPPAGVASLQREPPH